MEWPADKIERWSVEKLVPHARNVRTHSPEQISQIAAAIREWGWTVPVLVDEGGTIIAGHGRILAAQRLGLTEVPVMQVSGWSDAKKRAYMLADNKLSENAGWDRALLSIEVADLKAMGFDPTLAGFSIKELKDLKELPELTPVEPSKRTTTYCCPSCGHTWASGH